MKFWRNPWISMSLGFCVLFILIFTKPMYGQVGQMDRLEGADRYQTAIAISREGWEKSAYVVLARGDDFADGLCAVPLAAKYQAPILLTPPYELSQATLEEIKRLQAEHVLIAGGTGAISSDVENVLRNAGISDIRRFDGIDRYETSIKIAREFSGETVVLATGEDFPDALSISVPAAQHNMPILLTRKNYLPESVKDYLQANGVKQTYLIGGENVISSAISNAVPGAYRLSGNDRYQTNVAVLKHFEQGISFEHLYVADGGGPRGNEFADALAGAVLAAKKNSPLILADNYLDSATAAYLLPKMSISTQVTGFGGESAVPTSLLRSILDLIITADGSLSVHPTRWIAGRTATFTLTYTLGEKFSNGTVEFLLPEELTALEEEYELRVQNADLSGYNMQLKDSGRKVTINGITGNAGAEIVLILDAKSFARLGNYKIKVLADADGPEPVRVQSYGNGKAVYSLQVHSEELGFVPQQLISKNRSYRSLEPIGFVIHSTATPGSTAQSIYRYFNSAYRAASAHYVADWNETIQMIPENEVAWHAGPSANYRYLSIEMCEPKGYNPQEFQKVWDRTVLLVADACVRYGWSVKDIFSHNTISLTYRESDHTDPIGFLARYGRTWQQLIEAIDAKIQELNVGYNLDTAMRERYN